MKFFIPSVLVALALTVSVGCQPETATDDVDISTTTEPIDAADSIEPVEPAVDSNLTDTVETPDSNLTGETETPE